MRAELRALEGFQEKCLVHGDYFPGNVFVDDRLTICGVGDFGYTTVVGDSRMDLAGAVVYLEVVDGYRPDDTAFLTRLVEERYGRDMLRWIDFYRLYYSFYFSRCKVDDPRTYEWCIGNLRSWLQEH
jgi:aminoglycoside phosphotransferase (APT) family kinase protein